MKPKKTGKITASSIIAGMMTASIAFVPGCNRMEVLYGPPPMEDITPAPEETEVPENNGEINENYDPENNFEAPVYGPPPGDEPAQFDPSENEPTDIYGPPPGDG